MTIRQLEYFMAVARTLSFSEASKRMFVSQPALSRGISALEEELGVILFFRDRHTVALTPAGLVLATAVPKLKAELERAVGQVQQAEEGVRGKMDLAALCGTSMPPVLTSALDYFRDSLPYIEVRLRSVDGGDAAALVRDGGADAAFAFFPADAEEISGLGCLVLSEENACVAVQAELPVQDGTAVEIAELRGETFIFACPESSSLVSGWRGMCSAHGFVPKTRFADSVSTQMLWIERGYGVGVFPEDHRAFASAAVRRLRPNARFPLLQCVVWNRMNLNASLDLFVKLLKGDI